MIIGVDTHQDEHVAVAIDEQGVRLAERYALAARPRNNVLTDNRLHTSYSFRIEVYLSL